MEALWKPELVASPVQDFNDPFECLSQFLPEDEYRSDPEPIRGINNYLRHSAEFCSDTKGIYSERFFVLALSKARNNLRMWSQYGDLHRGFMLTLNAKKLGDLAEHIVDVRYNGMRVDLYNAHLEKRHAATLREVLSNKGVDWREERESRFLFHAEQFDGFAGASTKVKSRKIGRIGFLGGSLKAFVKIDHSAIEAVTLGWQSDLALEMTVRRIREFTGSQWRILKARPHKDKFAIVEDDVDLAPSWDADSDTTPSIHELDLLAHQIAEKAAKQSFGKLLRMQSTGKWYKSSSRQATEARATLEYLNGMGLLESHPKNPDLVRLRGKKS